MFNLNVIRTKPDLSQKTTPIKSAKQSVNKSPHKSSRFNNNSQIEPIIREGWLEISEASGILRRGNVFGSLSNILS
jgi:hypothetical protein